MICIIGESAAGKSTIERELEKRGFKRIISYTSRPIRNNEKYDVDYHYISKEEFEDRLNNGFFIEDTRYRGWFYGIAREDCIDDAISVVEPIGYRKLKNLSGLNVISFYIKTSERTRMIRMAIRGDDINEIIRRLYSDQGSFACINEEVDFIVSNEDRTIEETVDEILNIINRR